MKINKKIKERFWAKVKKGGEDDCWEWIGAKARKYGYSKIKGKFIGAHKLSYKINKGLIPKGILVLHSCDNPPCVNPKHLWLGTQLENMKDRDKKGRMARGEKIGICKLTQKQVNEIREKYNKRDISQRGLAKQYKISQFNISLIINNKTWKN